MPLDLGIAERLKRNEAGLVCAVVQDATTGRVLMVAWMNDDALEETLRTRRGVYFSRSRNEIWRKGETSGNVQHVISAELDCDGDAILLRVAQVGGACHTGKDSCFDEGGSLSLGAVAAS
ncbi:phosphoribosyl-AMP cyclohydrolase [Demequina sp. TTPB684]|uniref:phosphoribosyl-AMP cyclohydrolase n=1 Tax=unclassified Demequina TaxID=2620311 RepID=UPI001CF4826A|nr:MULTISPECIES: phosphoribosyl-AMP cyclohydrolase [unclassified Demequina]MCB2413931.1 phosphoribosyl-AMP cyclohydrolase [Demequina sp. TTPB684]UPU89381.1 phosphoribosyl-AMP cyclohydrolase [Demequina sp. TMPB413]